MLQGHFRLTLMVFKSHGDQHFQREICSHAVVCRRDDIALCVGKTICKDNPFHWNNFTINTRAPVIFPLSGAHTVEIFASHTKVHLAEWAGVILRSPPLLEIFGLRPYLPYEFTRSIERARDKKLALRGLSGRFRFSDHFFSLACNWMRYSSSRSRRSSHNFRDCSTQSVTSFSFSNRAS